MADSSAPPKPRGWWMRLRDWLGAVPGWLGSESLGRRGERIAAEHLRGRGYVVLARSHRSRLGEIDLIARDGEWLIFVEVKTRVGHRRGHPVEAVDTRKQRRIVRLAEQWLKRNPQPAGVRVRFDVIGVVCPTDRSPPVITHLEHAFRA